MVHSYFLLFPQPGWITPKDCAVAVPPSLPTLQISPSRCFKRNGCGTNHPIKPNIASQGLRKRWAGTWNDALHRNSLLIHFAPVLHCVHTFKWRNCKWALNGVLQALLLFLLSVKREHLQLRTSGGARARCHRVSSFGPWENYRFWSGRKVIPWHGVTQLPRDSFPSRKGIWPEPRLEVRW